MTEVRTPPMNQSERRLYLIEALLAERPDGTEIAIPADANDQRRLLRALMNVRPPEPLAPEVLAIQDAYLAQRLIERGGATQIDTLAFRDRIAVWRGDITLLAADAIVNAANDQMLGCFVPGTAASTMRYTRMPGCSCARPAPSSWTRKATPNPRDE